MCADEGQSWGYVVHGLQAARNGTEGGTINRDPKPRRRLQWVAFSNRSDEAAQRPVKSAGRPRGCLLEGERWQDYAWKGRDDVSAWREGDV